MSLHRHDAKKKKVWPPLLINTLALRYCAFRFFDSLSTNMRFLMYLRACRILRVHRANPSRHVCLFVEFSWCHPSKKAAGTALRRNANLVILVL